MNRILWSYNTPYPRRVLNDSGGYESFTVVIVVIIAFIALIVYLFHRWDKKDFRLFQSIHDYEMHQETEFNLAAIFDECGTSRQVSSLSFFTPTFSTAEIKQKCSFVESESESRFSFTNPYGRNVATPSPGVSMVPLASDELAPVEHEDTDSPISRLMASHSRSDDGVDDRDLSTIVMRVSSLSDRQSSCGPVEATAPYSAALSPLAGERQSDANSTDECYIGDVQVQPFRGLPSFESWALSKASRSSHDDAVTSPPRPRAPQQTGARPSSKRRFPNHLRVNTQLPDLNGADAELPSPLASALSASSPLPRPGYAQHNSPALWVSFPATSLLAERPWTHRLRCALLRHHRLLSMCTHPSARHSRGARCVEAFSDVLCLAFACALLLRVLAASGGQCEANLSEGSCGLQEGRLLSILGERCHWHSARGVCLFSPAPLYLVTFSLCTLTLATPIQMIIRALIEEVCSMKPVLLEESDLRAAAPPSRVASNPPSTPAASLSVSRSSCDGSERDSTEDYVLSGFSMARFNHMFPQDEARILLTAASAAIKEYMTAARSSGSTAVSMVSDLRSLSTFDSHGAVRHKGPPMLAADMLRSDSENISALQEALRTEVRGGEVCVSSKIAAARTEAASVVALSAQLSGGAEGRPPERGEHSSRVLLHRYILEQLSSRTRYVIGGDMLRGPDSHSLGRVGLFAWVVAWECVCLAWGGMGAWLVYTLLSDRYTHEVSTWWVEGLLVALCFDWLVVEVAFIWWRHVHLKGLLLPQLRDIFGILSDILLLRFSGRVLPARGLRAVQHTSAACRASRFPSVRHCTGAAILRHVDDVDVSVCRRNRVVGGVQLGLVSGLLLEPSAWIGMRHRWLYWVSHVVVRSLFSALVCAFVLLHLFIIGWNLLWLLVLYAFISSYILLLKLFRILSDGSSKHVTT